jgi:hypothetical protein
MNHMKRIEKIGNCFGNSLVNVSNFANIHMKNNIVQATRTFLGLHI